MRNIRSHILGIVIISLTLLAGACGQKGDLYHPEHNQQSSLSSPS